MMNDKQHRDIWAMVEADTTHHPDHKVFFGSGKHLLQRVAFGILPSFIHKRLRPAGTKAVRLHSTSYLDGLRGVASFIVFMGHYTEENIGWYTEPYGLYEDNAASSPLQLPFVRVIYSARPMVHIFFIISGYVLSCKPLKQIHSQQYASLTTTLSSSVFRRALRLFLPSLITLFMMSIAVHYGISDNRFAPSYFALSSQLEHCWATCWELLTSSWKIERIGNPQPSYNPALWTIPVEFAQSMILFVTLLGLSRCVTNVRLFLLGVIMSVCIFGGQLYTVEFLGGMFIAEVILLQEHPNYTPNSSPQLPKYVSEDIPERKQYCPTIQQRALQLFWIANVISGLFIASWTNNHAEEVWGIRVLEAHTPSPYEGQQVWFCLSAFQIVLACTQLPLLQSVFNTPVAQYLGSISYALYLTHNLCLTTLEPRIVPIIDAYFGKATSWGRHFSWVAGLLVYLPVIIWVADLFWRAVDTQTVRFARWAEGKCVVAPKKI